MKNRISLEEFRKKLESHRDLIVIEALPPRYFAEGHIPGAINVPHDTADEEIPRILGSTESPIVVYCASGPCKNSAILTERLLQLGYRQTFDYHEGKAEWKAKGLPLEQ